MYVLNNQESASLKKHNLIVLIAGVVLNIVQPHSGTSPRNDLWNLSLIVTKVLWTLECSSMRFEARISSLGIGRYDKCM
jgi:hypothetical protein